MPSRTLAAGWLLTLAGVLAPGCAERPATPGPAERPAAEGAYDWGVAYFCPYDNDLERAGPIVLQRIRAGLASPRQAVALQADDTDAGGMRRFAVTAQGVTQTRVTSDDSSTTAGRWTN